MAEGALVARKGEKRAAIVSAALALFAERGFDGTAVPQVAERAGVGAGTIYRYFANKEALVNAVFQEHKGRLVGALLGEFPFDASPREQLAAFWRRATRWVRENPLAFRFLELHHHAPYLDGRSRAIEARVEAAVERFFAEGAARRIIKPLPAALLAAIVWGSLVGIVRAESLGHLELTDEVLAQAEQAIWEAIRA